MFLPYFCHCFDLTWSKILRLWNYIVVICIKIFNVPTYLFLRFLQNSLVIGLTVRMSLLLIFQRFNNK